MLRAEQIATIEIGVEVKILQKAMIKQIDRVTTTLIDQALHFRSRGGQPICVAVVGINQADYTVSFEGEMTWRTDGKKHKHPIQEAAEAERRLVARAAPHFDELSSDTQRRTSHLIPSNSEMRGIRNSTTGRRWCGSAENMSSAPSRA
jgi:hypothetical protein